jgi:hypothetical protein
MFNATPLICAPSAPDNFLTSNIQTSLTGIAKRNGKASSRARLDEHSAWRHP